jgi:hypothetical protein
MDHYEIHSFKDRLASVEQYFIEIAANEEQLLTFGFRKALDLPSAEKAFEALKTFDEDFSKLKRFMLRMDRMLGQELENLEADGKLVEQVSLIALRLRMEAARKPVSSSLGFVNRILIQIPYVSSVVKRNGLFKEESVHLHKTIINLGRLRGLANSSSEIMLNQQFLDDEVFKPSSMKPERVLELIDSALADIEELSSVSPTERARVQGYLLEAKKEILSSNPSWAKIVGALVIVAAVTSGLADAPGAAKNIKDAIEYILGTSIEKPLRKYLPAPPGNEMLQVPSGNLA